MPEVQPAKYKVNYKLWERYIQNRDILPVSKKASATISDCFEEIAVLILLNNAVAELLNTAALLILYLAKNMVRGKI